MKTNGLLIVVALIFGLLLVCSLGNVCYNKVIEGLENKKHEKDTKKKSEHHKEKKDYEKEYEEEKKKYEKEMKEYEKELKEKRYYQNKYQNEKKNNEEIENMFHNEYVGPAGDVVDTYKPVSHGQEEHQGIPKSQIPEGSEDLYILKSQVVPPVCPACPSVTECPRQEPCPACPPCARCPEPAFECKKVPNYSRSAGDNDMLPMPVLSDFSQFGM